MHLFYSVILITLSFIILGSASSLTCHQCESSKDAVHSDCLASSSNSLKKCPEHENFCVIIEEFTKNSKNEYSQYVNKFINIYNKYYNFYYSYFVEFKVLNFK